MHFFSGAGPEKKVSNALNPFKVLPDLVFKKCAVGLDMPGIALNGLEKNPDNG
jgi:hypothetical protein